MRQEMQAQGLAIREMCEAARVSRASYYRSWSKQEPQEEQVALRDAIQRLALKDRHCGYRRIGVLLKREGWMVNHKRVLRLMREDNLLSIRRRQFVVTTDSLVRCLMHLSIVKQPIDPIPTASINSRLLRPPAVCKTGAVIDRPYNY